MDIFDGCIRPRTRTRHVLRASIWCVDGSGAFVSILPALCLNANVPQKKLLLKICLITRSSRIIRNESYTIQFGTHAYMLHWTMSVYFVHFATLTLHISYLLYPCDHGMRFAGAGNKQLAGVWLQVSLAVLFVIGIPVIALWYR